MSLLSFTEVGTSEPDERILNIPETPTTVEVVTAFVWLRRMWKSTWQPVGGALTRDALFS